MKRYTLPGRGADSGSQWCKVMVKVKVTVTAGGRPVGPGACPRDPSSLPQTFPLNKQTSLFAGAQEACAVAAPA